MNYDCVFVSLFRNMARFGLLISRGGFWRNTEPLMDEDFYNSMTSPSQILNEAYGYLRWLNGG